jgi:putative ATP-dependent endonuclease of OLD family
MTEDEFRALARMYSLYPAGREMATRLRGLQQESIAYLSSVDVASLESYLKRTRGEALFARSWLLCEGQSEYFVVRYFAELLGVPLDQSGVNIIDYRNNGTAGTFVGLALALGMPWVLTKDNDEQGNNTEAELRGRGLKPTDALWRVREFKYKDLEELLVKEGFADEYDHLSTQRGWTSKYEKGTVEHLAELSEWVRKDKVRNPLDLITELRNQRAGADRIPAFWRGCIEEAVKLANGTE